VVERIVILGAGQAAAQAVETLRQRGFKGSLVLVGDEPHLPYQRPPLSKKYLVGQLEGDRLFIRQAQYYSERAVETLLGRRALEIDRHARRVGLDDGSSLAYDALLIATGSRPRRLSVAGADLEGVRYLRTIADVDALRAAVEPGRRLVIIGGGYLGLEMAASCRQLGLEVVVLEMAERVMQRVMCVEMSAFYAAEHARRGVRIVCNARVKEIVPHPGTRSARAVLCEGGTEYPADIVLVGVGVEAVDELALRAGLECSNGIIVDAHCRTSDPNIYAAGDCTSHPSARYGMRVRLESVDNAFEQAAVAARNMLGEAASHDKVPWFWSDQYDLKLIIVGLGIGHDATVRRGEMASRSFSVCYLRGGELIAVDTVNNPKDQMAARKLVAARVRVDPQKLADPTIALKDCV
jgi:3-phenylpropionate/trans-cinnamate dioxygenase ferredoxin reductase component